MAAEFDGLSETEAAESSDESKTVGHITNLIHSLIFLL